MREPLSARLFQPCDPLPSRVDAVWLIRRGVVKVLTWDQEGETVTLGYWGEGDLVGRPLSRVQPYEMQCCTAVEADCIPLDRNSCLSSAICRHVQQTEHLLCSFRRDRPRERCLKMLIQLSHKFGCPAEKGQRIDLRLTHRELAEMIGVTRVSITRTLSEFQRQGLIDRSEGRIIVLPAAEATLHP
jgi:CRP-like cAMP-binding protein